MFCKFSQRLLSVVTGAALVLGSLGDAWAAKAPNPADSYTTTTPIKHVVVLFQENVSFDHYFGTYPFAANPANEPAFVAVPDTPGVNNLLSGGLLTENPNSVQPFRLDRSQEVTCSQNHGYSAEQKAHNLGAMDKFVESTGTGGPNCPDFGFGKGLVMGYYDGNTVTAYWNYAQHYAMSDNSFNTQFGPSTPGAINLISGNTGGATFVSGNPSGNVASSGAIIGDPRPAGDDCNPTGPAQVTFPDGTINVGDLLNGQNFTWGWFQGGFKPTSVDSNGAAHCGAQSVGLPGTVTDYIPHHEPFQYFPGTKNPHHLRPTGTVGTTDQANHQYDLQDFFDALAAGQLPAVSFLKAKAVNDGHPGNSDPLDEQSYVVSTINKIQASPEWKSTAIVIAYDDSDGWYDHVMDPIVNQSQVTDDFLTGTGLCGTNVGATTQGRCGYGPRLPLIVISPYSKQNYVDHGLTDQSSILRFIEDNWGLGRIGAGSTDAKAGTLINLFDFGGKKAAKLKLDPQTGTVAP
jgi:phospholipase C